ncbi:MAG: hypothetical protein ACE5HL_09585 [Terriglobia bacterium]
MLKKVKLWIVVVTSLVLAGALVSLWLSLKREGTRDQETVSAHLPSSTEVPEATERPKIPNLVPGQSVQEAKELFGAEYSAHSSATSEWKRYEWRLRDYDVLVWTDGAGKMEQIATRFNGTVVEAPDGVLLGRDTLMEVTQKVATRVVPGSEHLFSGEGLWIYYFEIYPESNRRWRIEYSFALDENNPEELAILDQEHPITKNVFKNVPVNVVTIKLPEKPDARR